MRMLSFALATALLSFNAYSQNMQPPHTTLKEGDVAPNFTLPATVTESTPRGTKVTLSDYKGKFNVVLAFFPAAFTGG